MEAKTKKAAAGKIASLFIVAVVAVGALAISGVADVSGAGSGGKLFILFLGAVIVLQVIPGLMLMGAMFKGVYSMITKKVSEPAAGNAK